MDILYLVIGVGLLILVFRMMQSPGPHAEVAGAETVNVDDVNDVFESLRETGSTGSFAVFMFEPETLDDELNIQYSIEEGVIGADWVLNGNANIAEREKFEEKAKKFGCVLEEKFVNECRYLRTEQGDLVGLFEQILRDYRFENNIDLIVEGFDYTAGNAA